MATIQELITRVEKLNFNDIVTKSIRRTTSKLVDLQQFQWLEGKRSDGNRIGRYRNPKYAAYKYGYFSPLAGFGNVDLTLKKRFSNAAYATVQGNSITFGSRDSKSDSLEKKYGKTIFGLDDQNVKIYSQDYLMPDVMIQIKKDVYNL